MIKRILTEEQRKKIKDKKSKKEQAIAKLVALGLSLEEINALIK